MLVEILFFVLFIILASAILWKLGMHTKGISKELIESMAERQSKLISLGKGKGNEDIETRDEDTEEGSI